MQRMLSARIRFWGLISIGFLMSATACKKATHGNENFQYTQELPARAEDALSPEQKACLATPGRICEAGILPGFRGMKMDSVKIAEGNGIRVRDSLARENGYEWRVRRVEDGQGRLTFESQPVDEGDPASKLPKADLLRVLIEHPGFSTEQGVALGATVADLEQVFGKDQLNAVPIPAYGKVQLSVEGSRILYMIDDPNKKLAALSDKRSGLIPLRKLPATAAVSMIVVMFL